MSAEEKFATIVAFVFCFFASSCKGQHAAGVYNTLPDINRAEEMRIRSEKASEVISYMNLSADPCKDFYDFACGSWPKKYSARLHENRVITTEHLLELKINEQLQNLLKAGSNAEDDGNTNTAKHFFQTCTAARSASTAQHNFLINFVRQYGGLPMVPGTNWRNNYNWLQTVALLRSNYGIEALIGLEIDINLQTLRGKSIYLTEPKTTILPVELCSKVASQLVSFRDKEYELFQRKISRNMQKWLSLGHEDANRFAGDIIYFEFSLCKHMRKDQALLNETADNEVPWGNQRGGAFNLPHYRTGQSRLSGPNPVGILHMNLQQLNQHFANDIDFKYFVQTVFEKNINDQVYLRSESYFRNLALLVKNSKASLPNYIMYKALASFNFPTDDHPHKRSQYCVELVRNYFPKVVSEMFSRKFKRMGAFAEIQTIYRDIKVAFGESLQAQWLMENFKRIIKQELDQFEMVEPDDRPIDMGIELNSLDFWHQLESVMKFNSKKFLEKLYMVGSYNQKTESVEAFEIRLLAVPSERAILTGYGLLQPYFYHNGYARSLKFSGLGQKMAKELVKAIDESYWNQNSMSVLRWDEYTTESYRNFSQCFRKQYSNYYYNSPDIFQNATMLRDFIADSIGVKVAFNAYLLWLENISSSSRGLLLKETLPAVDFTNTQLFFINFAQSRCFGKKDEKPILGFSPLESHSLEKYLVNGPLSNFDEFSREFGCAPGTEMNIDDKCVVF